MGLTYILIQLLKIAIKATKLLIEETKFGKKKVIIKYLLTCMQLLE